MICRQRCRYTTQVTRNKAFRIGVIALRQYLCVECVYNNVFILLRGSYCMWTADRFGPTATLRARRLSTCYTLVSTTPILFP